MRDKRFSAVIYQPFLMEGVPTETLLIFIEIVVNYRAKIRLGLMEMRHKLFDSHATKTIKCGKQFDF